MNEVYDNEYERTPRQTPQRGTPVAMELSEQISPQSDRQPLTLNFNVNISINTPTGPTVRDFTLEYEEEQPKAMEQDHVDSASPEESTVETDPHRLAQRQKQIDFGKNTLGYQRYIEAIPKESRRRRNGYCLDPATPDLYQKCSKRCFDGQIKKWRRDLHKWDPDYKQEEAQVEQQEISPVKKEEPENKLGGDRKRGFEKAFKGTSRPGCMYAPLQEHNRQRHTKK